MDASRAALMVVGVHLVAVWAAAAGGRAAGVEPAASPQVTAEQAVGEASTSLIAAAERLQAHARRDVAPAMVRDPFSFGVEARPSSHRASEPAHPAAPADAPADVEPPAAPEPDIVLQGMAESGEAENLVRTAILRVGGDLVLASLGERVGGRYEIVALTADSVELESVVDHARLTCRMK